jgi:hypothetical protein
MGIVVAIETVLSFLIRGTKQWHDNRTAEPVL